MGCAECRALRVYRGVDTLQRIVGVDIDRQLLIDSSSRLKPSASDYLFRRDIPLTVELYNGSLVDCDRRLQPVDAVTLIEVLVCLRLISTLHTNTSAFWPLYSSTDVCWHPQLRTG